MGSGVARGPPKGRQAQEAAKKKRSGYLAKHGLMVPETSPRTDAVLVGLTAFGLYCSTIYTSVPGGDATELIFNACQFSVAHPPGYPTFTMLAGLFIRVIPSGWGEYFAEEWEFSPALKANLAAAACGGAAAGFLCRASRLLTGCRASSLAAAGLFALSPLTWNYSIQAEVFAMNNMFVAMLAYLLILYCKDPCPEHAYLGALVCGLGLTNQHTIVFVVAPVVVYVLGSGRRTLLAGATVARLAFYFLLGMSPYAYLVAASWGGKPGSWGDTGTLGGFLTHILRREYGTLTLFSGANADSNRLLGLYHYGVSMLKESLYAVPPAYLLALGAAVTARRPAWDVTALRLLLFVHLFYTLGFHYLGNLPIRDSLYLGVHARFWMQSHAVAAVVAAYGFKLAVGEFRRRVGRVDLLPLVLLALSVASSRRVPEMDETRNDLIYKYGRWLLDDEAVPDKAKVVVKGDLITNTVRYLQVCEGIKPDVQTVDMSMMTYKWFVKKQAHNFPDIKFPGTCYHPYEEGAFSMRKFLDANNVKGAPVYMMGGWHEQDPTPHEAYAHLPWGPADIPVELAKFSFGEYADVWEWFAATKLLNPHFMLPDRVFAPERWERVVIHDYFHQYHKSAHHLLLWAIGDDKEGEAIVDPVKVRALEEVVKEYERILAEHPHPGDYLYLNLGVAYQRMLRVDQHANDMTRRKIVDVMSKYLKLVPAGDQALQVQQLVDAMKQIIFDNEQKAKEGTHAGA